MTLPDDGRRAARARASASLLEFLKAQPFSERLTEGAVMALQAVIGATLAYWIGRALHTEQAFWAAITAIAVSQHNYVDTRKLSRDQFIGAMVGGVFGLAGALAGGGSFVVYMLTVAVAIITCWCLNIGSAARLGGITATIMLLVPGVAPPWDIALLRLGEVTLGTVCALVVAWLMSNLERRLFGQKDPN
ncbi:FUSC family protein [Paraburkholderia sp.]|uniref:FUSC family protein n=1 Tax=Paraburkholderia sp. TaxID=1926495 RepID=UPI00239624E8|nr:FUSC family protein [Paraburkholderia sp.]MDE1181641.1 FUSC family protein [Paraburkholderia sp.]